MGCCTFVNSDVKSLELISAIQGISESLESGSFNDISLTSDLDMPPLREWMDYKNFKSVTESSDLFNSINYSCKNKDPGVKTLSNQGSIVDSFSINLSFACYHK